MRHTNSALRRNRRILEGLLCGEETKVRRELLIIQGFNPLYHTHKLEVVEGVDGYFCYELGYADLGTGEVLIVRQGI